MKFQVEKEDLKNVIDGPYLFINCDFFFPAIPVSTPLAQVVPFQEKKHSTQVSTFKPLIKRGVVSKSPFLLEIFAKLKFSN